MTRILTCIEPTFAAEGKKGRQIFIWLFPKFEEAVTLGQNLVFRGYSKVSVYRVEGFTKS